MIEVEIYRDAAGKICEFKSKGAIDYEERNEPVQVSVSALLQTAVVGLEDYLKLEPEVERDEGWLRCKLEREYFLNREIDAILETMLLGLRVIEGDYPSYLEIKEVVSDVKV